MIGAKNKGFTLVEVLVATFVFFIVVGAVVGVLISAVQAQTAILKEQRAVAEISYVMEYMSRALRMAQRDDENICIGIDPHKYNYELIGASGDYGGTIKFLNYKDECQEFSLSGGVIYETRSGAQHPMTSDTNVYVNALSFHKAASEWHLREVDPHEGNQSKVMINIKIGSEEGETSVILQTTVSQRNLNVPIVEVAE